MGSIIQPAERIKEVKEYFFSRKLREIRALDSKEKPVINLGIGSPDREPAMEIIQTLNATSNFAENHGYQSYIGISELREAFSDWYKRFYGVKLNPEKEVLPLIGSKEGIMHISLAFLNPGDGVLIPDPGYPVYRSVSELVGAKVHSYDLSETNNWLPNLDAFDKDFLKTIKIMWVNYPHMPTGTKASEGFFDRLINFGKENDILICHDNPYSFILNTNPRSILSIPDAKDIALELNSLSKSHNMAGWRVGMIAGSEKYIANILNIKSNVDSGMFKPIQLASAKALRVNGNWFSNLNEEYEKRRELVWQMLDTLSCSFDKNQSGLFVWAKTGKNFNDGLELSDYLLSKHHIFVTPGSVFGKNGENYIRVSLCQNKDILYQALERIKTEN